MAQELKPCGTYAAYRRHRYNGEPPCDDCVAAQRAYMRKYRPLKPSALAPCGSVAAYFRHTRSGEKPCDACRSAVNAYNRQRYAAQQVGRDE